MPRLSIIVPHLSDDHGLEASLLSILENRPNDCEVLVAHSGEYQDPYELGRDEVLMVNVDAGMSIGAQVNNALAAACAPIVHFLLPGTLVSPNWVDEAVSRFEDRSIDAIAIPIESTTSNETFFGIDVSALPHRRIATSRRKFGGPLLSGGVFRRKTLLKLNGLFESSSREVTEVELALLFNALGLGMDVLDRSTLSASSRVATGCEPNYEIGVQCGRIACAYSEMDGSGVVIDSLARRLGHLAGGLMSPKTVAERLGWVMGIRDRSWVASVHERFERAFDAIHEQAVTLSIDDASQAKEIERQQNRQRRKAA